jgi:hypothetical protein
MLDRQSIPTTQQSNSLLHEKLIAGPPKIDIPEALNWTPKDLEKLSKAPSTFAQMTANVGKKNDHPLYGLRKTALLPMDVERVKGQLSRAIGSVGSVEEQVQGGITSLGSEEPASLSAIEKLGEVTAKTADLSVEVAPFVLQIAANGSPEAVLSICQKAHQYLSIIVKHQSKFKPITYTTSLEYLREPLAEGTTIFGKLKGRYKKASEQMRGLLAGSLPEKAQDRLELLNNLIETQLAHTEFTALGVSASSLVGELWQNTETNLDAMEAAAKWILDFAALETGMSVVAAAKLVLNGAQELNETSKGAFSLSASLSDELQPILEVLEVDLEQVFGGPVVRDIPLSSIKTKMQLWHDNLERLDEWSRIISAEIALEQNGLATLSTALSDGSLSPTDAVGTLK